MNLLLILLVCFIFHIKYFLHLTRHHGLPISNLTTLIDPLAIFLQPLSLDLAVYKFYESFLIYFPLFIEILLVEQLQVGHVAGLSLQIGLK